MPNNSRYHCDAARTGWFHGETRGVSPVGNWRKLVDVNLGSAVRGAPLLLEGWTIPGHDPQDLVLVATSTNLVNAYALTRLAAGQTAPLWSTPLPAASSRGGSNIP